MIGLEVRIAIMRVKSLLLLLFLLASCQSVSPSPVEGLSNEGIFASRSIMDAEGKSKKEYFRLNKSPEIKNPTPLPAGTELAIEKLDDQMEVIARYAARGWDFNDDGAYDMVEVLSAAGEGQAYYFDFDFDGKIDLERLAP